MALIVDSITRALVALEQRWHSPCAELRACVKNTEADLTPHYISFVYLVINSQLSLVSEKAEIGTMS